MVGKTKMFSIYELGLVLAVGVGSVAAHLAAAAAGGYGEGGARAGKAQGCRL